MVSSREAKIRALLESLMKLPNETFNHVIDLILTFLEQYANSRHYNLIINVNASMHHDIRSAISCQFTFDKYIDLTKGTLNFEQMIQIPKRIVNIVREAHGKIGLVLTGHPLMQLFSLASVIASYGEVTAIIWSQSLRMYFTRTYKKFRPTTKFKPIKNTYDVIVPTNPLRMTILDELGDLKVHVVCKDVGDPVSWESCYRRTISLILGNRNSMLLIDAPWGLPATIATEIIECIGLKLKILTTIDEKFRLLELDHSSFRDLNFKVEQWNP